MSEKPKLKRVVIYVPEKDYKILRALLIIKGMSVSGWIRDIIKSFLKENSNRV